MTQLSVEYHDAGHAANGSAVVVVREAPGQPPIDTSRGAGVEQLAARLILLPAGTAVALATWPPHGIHALVERRGGELHFHDIPRNQPLPAEFDEPRRIIGLITAFLEENPGAMCILA